MIIGGTREFAGYEEQNTFEAIDVMMKRAARYHTVPFSWSFFIQGSDICRDCVSIPLP